MPGPIESRRLLALANDDRLVEQIRRGSEAAFEVAFERHSPAILGFCRHMLGSLAEAEDAVQQTFASAYHDLVRHPDRETMLKPWLFAIARNRCLIMLRARREQPTDSVERATESLSEQVEQRDELRQLLADVGEVPYEQRAALLLAELGDLSHAEIAGVLGCEVPRVKALVFRARSGLIQRREARDIACSEIQEQLANLRGGSLRRNELRLHLRECTDLQRLPRAGQAAAAHACRGAAGGALAGAQVECARSDRDRGGSAAAGAGLGAASIAGGFGSATVAKVAIVGLLAGGGGIVGTTVVDSVRDRAATTSPSAGRDEAAGGGAAGESAERRAEDNPPSQEGAAGGSGARALAAPPRRPCRPGLPDARRSGAAVECGQTGTGRRNVSGRRTAGRWPPSPTSEARHEITRQAGPGRATGKPVAEWPRRRAPPP